MKIKRYLFLAVLFPSFILSQWQTYQTSTNNDFIDVCVVNQNIIWASGYNGTVFKTTDGGNTWILANGGLGQIPIMHITAVDQYKAWLTSGSNSRGIFLTSNGGNNWVEIDYSPKNFIDKIHFFNSNTGYFIADQVNDTLGFFISRNGGLSWHRSPNAPAGLENFALIDNMVSQLDTNFIWFNMNLNFSSRFYKLTGGLYNQWQMLNTGIGAARGTIFKDAQNGLMNSGRKVYKTSNGGVNWTFLKDSLTNGNVITDFINVSGTNWVILNTTGSIIISYDFGNIWQPLISYPAGSFWLHNSDSKDTNSIWIAADNGRLLKYNSHYIGINTIGIENIPSDFSLSQNYPNPFNPETKIRFTLPVHSDFSITVYDIAGREVFSVKDSKPAGIYEMSFDGTDFASGIYYYKLRAGDFIKSRTMVLLK